MKCIKKAQELGFVPTEDESYRDSILVAIEKKGGYCPCKVQRTEENICPCHELRTLGTCTCRLFVPAK